jgi:hypothetical protein
VVTWDVNQDDVALQVSDTNSIDMTLTGSGTTADPWIVSADAVLDPNANNLLSVGPNGLLVLETVTTLVDNGDGSFTYTSEDGTVTIWNETTTSIAYNSALHQITYTDEDGNPQVLDLNVGDLAYDAVNNTLTYTNEEGVATALPLNNVTVTNTVAGHLIATVTNELGTAVDINETITSISNFALDPATNILSFDYTDEAGVVNTPSVDLSSLAVDINVASVTFDAATNILTVTETDGSTHPINLTDLVDTYTLVNNGDGTFQVNDTGGTPSGAIIDVCQLIIDGGCPVSVMGNVNTNTDAPAGGSLFAFDADLGEWVAWDPTTSTLNCANLGG